MLKKIAIGVVVLFAIMAGYFSCLKETKQVEMCEKRGGCWNVEANECEFEDMSKCK